MLEIGDRAPDFEMSTDNDKVIKLGNLKGSLVILYFYPKDDTPGCTIEAKEFNDLKGEFDKYNAIIIGVSKDNLKSHQKFKEKYCLNFDLAFDDAGICEKYSVWGEKSMYGKKYMGINRATFLIGKDGNIAHIWPKVSPNGHAKEVLDVIKGME
jgi:peroxiredoxin Q/BCP